MRSKAFAGVACGLVVLGVSSPAGANGYLLYEASPAGVAQAGAMTADGTEAATVFYNPAGMTRLTGFQAQVSAVLYYAGAATFKGPSGVKEEAVPGLFPMPTMFASYKANDWLAVGFGGFSAYGLGVTWPVGWTGYTAVKKASLESYSLQPSFAIGPWNGLSFGAGIDFLFGSVDLSRGIPFTDGHYGEARIGGRAAGVGFNVGAFYEANEWLRLGLTARSPIKIALDSGKADFTVPAPFQEALRDQAVRTSLTTPAVITLGARFKLMKDLHAELDATYVGWSVYDQLEFRFDTPALNDTQHKYWKSAYQIRTGGQYDLGDASFRAGFIFDKNPIPNSTLDPLLPDSDRLDFSGGGGYSFGKFRVDGAYMFVYFLPRTVGAENPFPGTYNVHAHVFSLGASIKL